MRVDDEIRNQALASERHVFLAVSDTNRAFLTVARGKFIPNLGDLGGSHPNLDEAQAFGVSGQEDLIDDPIFRASERRRNIAFDMCLGPLAKFFVVRRDRCRLADDDVFARNANPGGNDPVFVQFIVRPVLELQRVAAHRFFELLHHRHADPLLLIGICSIEKTSEKPPVDAALVHDNGIFLIVSRVASDGNDGILPRR